VPAPEHFQSMRWANGRERAYLRSVGLSEIITKA
jgi:hypothetical protein